MNINNNIDSNIIMGLERISEAFNVMMWEYNKHYGLSFIQLKIINFLMFNSSEDERNISFISKEFNISKASLSESIKNLKQKNLLFKSKSASDSRKEILSLTNKGKEVASNIFKFTDPLKEIVSKMRLDKKEIFFESIMYILHNLLDKNIISIKVICSNCKFYIDKDNKNFVCTFSKNIEEHNNKFQFLNGGL